MKLQYDKQAVPAPNGRSPSRVEIADAAAAKSGYTTHSRIMVRNVMRVKIWIAGFCAVAIALVAFSAPPAEAAQKKRTAAKKTVVKSAPKRPRITVRRRSFLDAGTHVLPGDRKFTDYALPPGYSPTSVIDNRAGLHRGPLPGPFDLPSRQNPYPWNWCVGC
jgi:hypothetical protein